MAALAVLPNGRLRTFNIHVKQTAIAKTEIAAFALSLMIFRPKNQHVIWLTDSTLSMWTTLKRRTKSKHLQKLVTFISMYIRNFHLHLTVRHVRTTINTTDVISRSPFSFID